MKHGANPTVVSLVTLMETDFCTLAQSQKLFPVRKTFFRLSSDKLSRFQMQICTLSRPCYVCHCFMLILKINKAFESGGCFKYFRPTLKNNKTACFLLSPAC
jgi:hypothetical protein